MPLRHEDVIKRNRFPNDGSRVVDIAIVGMGAGGSVQANRWARTFPHLEILTLENGRDDVRGESVGSCTIDSDGIVQPGCRDWGVDARALLNPQDPDKCFNWKYEVMSSPDDAMSTSPANGNRGSTYGGTTTTNVQVYYRGTKRGTWDRVQAHLGGDAEWSFEALVESFKRIENRRQKTISAVPSFLVTNSFDGYDIFDATEFENSSTWFSPEYFSTQENELPVSTTRSPNLFTESLFTAVKAAFGDRFANVRDSAGYGRTWSPELPEFDEALVGAPQTLVDQSAALLRYQTQATGEGDPFGALLPNTFKHFQYSSDTPGPAVRVANVWNMSEQFGQLAVWAYMNTQGPFNAFNNTNQIFLPGPDDTVLQYGAVFAAFDKARGNAAATFVNPLLGRSTERLNDVRSNYHVIDSARVDRLIFADELWHDGDPTRVVGVEYLDDAWDATRIGRGSNNPECTRATAFAASEEALKRARHRVYVTHEVVLSAGTFDTPAILQRSGIGRRSHLESLQDSVRTRVHLPGVGYNLHNHVDFTMLYSHNISADVLGPFSPGEGLFDATLRFRSTKSSVSDFHAIWAPRFTVPLLQDSTTVWLGLFGGATVLPTLVTSDARDYPTELFGPSDGNKQGLIAFEQMITSSKGSALIVSSDPTEPVRPFENLLGDDRDVEAYVDAIIDTIMPITEQLKTTTLRRVDYCTDGEGAVADCGTLPGLTLNTTFVDDGGVHFIDWVQPPRDELFSTHPVLGITVPDRGKIRRAVQRYRFQGWHESGTCAMGLSSNEQAVVDTHARVYNVRGVRVADTSVFPVAPDVNTMGPTYGASQRIFELACEEYRDTLGYSPALECKPSTKASHHASVASATTHASAADIDAQAMMRSTSVIGELRMAAARADFSRYGDGSK